MSTSTAVRTTQEKLDQSPRKPCWVPGGTAREAVEGLVLPLPDLTVSILARAHCCARVLFVCLRLT